MADDPKHPLTLKFLTDKKGMPMPEEVAFVVNSMKQALVLVAESIIREAHDHMSKEHVKSEHDQELVDETCATIHRNLAGSIKSMQILKTGDSSEGQ